MCGQKSLSVSANVHLCSFAFEVLTNRLIEASSVNNLMECKCHYLLDVPKGIYPEESPKYWAISFVLPNEHFNIAFSLNYNRHVPGIWFHNHFKLPGNCIKQTDIALSLHLVTIITPLSNSQAGINILSEMIRYKFKMFWHYGSKEWYVRLHNCR